MTTEESDPQPWEAALKAERARQTALIERAALPLDAPDWVRQLVLGADQFIVTRKIGDETGKSVIAGYPWFSDWGRDTMIALPGLTIDTAVQHAASSCGPTEKRRGSLTSDDDSPPEYNTVDAALWYFQAVYAWFQAVGADHPLLPDLYNVLTEIIRWHEQGTRYNIHRDPADGLLFAGEPGMQLTWMDIKADGWVATPRTGKPVEINALWYGALRVTAELALALGHRDDAARYSTMAQQVYAL